MPDALQMLRDDHKRVKDIFKQYEDAEDGKTKQELARTAIMELKIHSQLEEEIFYPAVREESDSEEMMDEAEEEHHVADMIMEELSGMRPGSKMDAKFTVLAENVKHHIDEEESEMLPKAAELGMERMNELGEEMAERKMQLQEEMQRPRRATTRNGGGRSRSRAGTMSNRAGGRTTKKATARKATPRRTATRGTTRSSAAKPRAATGSRTATKATARKAPATKSRASASRSAAGGASARSTRPATKTSSRARSTARR